MFIPACSGYDSVWRFFTEAEAKTVIAFAEQIIPADKDPGATDANVINFIDKQLVGPYTRFQEMYRKGIPAIENSAQKLFQKSFHELDFAVQTEFSCFQRWDTLKISGDNIEQFHLVFVHCQ
jgi:gluconate 2-dehydrogenase gamma chain